MASLDIALDYVRQNLLSLGPWYVLAILPMSAVVLLTIDVIMTQRRVLVPVICVALIAATLWRWVIQAIIQRRIQIELSGEEVASVWRCLGSIIVGRLVANAALTWGSFLLFPGLWGFFASGFVTPAALSPSSTVTLGLKRAMGMNTSGRLIRVSFALTFATMLVVLGIVVMQVLVVYLILPSLMGINSSAILLTMQSFAWTMAVAYCLYLLFDFYWTVASVFVFYDQQSRRLGVDLKLRLSMLEEGSK